MKEYIVEFRVRVTALDENDAEDQAHEAMAVGNFQTEIEEVAE
jgi:hypothetical protein